MKLFRCASRGTGYGLRRECGVRTRNQFGVLQFCRSVECEPQGSEGVAELPNFLALSGLAFSFHARMSIRYMSRVWEDAELKERCSLLLMLALADFANDSGECWPCIETLAKKARCTSRAVFDNLLGLENRGKVKRLEKYGPNKTNVYRLYPAPTLNPLHPEPTSPPCTQSAENSASGFTRSVRNRQEPSILVQEADAKPKNGKPKPTIEECKLQAAKIGLSDAEAEKFFHYYESVGWRTKAGPLRSWNSAMSGWKLRSAEYARGPNGAREYPRNQI